MLIHIKRILFVSILFFPMLVWSAEQANDSVAVSLYSEYYPNPNAAFMGTIIFENGSETSLEEWRDNAELFDCVKQYGNVLLYDRSGIGRSPPDLNVSVEHPITAVGVNAKLMMLLRQAQIEPPYILVGHSYGALYVGYFARQYPTSVKAILLVDPVPPEYEWSKEWLDQYQTDIQAMKHVTSQEAYQQMHTMSAQLFYQMMGFKKTKQQIARSPKMSNKIPIVILSSKEMAKKAPIKGNWYALQKQWLNKHLHSEILQVSGGHFIQREHPALVCEQIKTLVHGKKFALPGE